MRASDLGPTIGIALEAFNGEGGPPRNQRRFGTVLCFVKAGEGDTKAALARMSQSLTRMKDDNKQVTDENRRLQQENASLKTRLDRLEQQQSEVKQQQNQIELLKKLVCLDHPGADMCKRKD
jgi:predicted RNase H-like nuclease (RuvC/YqgF family)